MTNISEILSENFRLLVVNFSIYLNRRVFVMLHIIEAKGNIDKNCACLR